MSTATLNAATIEKPKSAADAYKRVRSVVEEIKTDETQRFPEAASPGDSVRQGDVYITLITHNVDNFKPDPYVHKPIAPPSPQLAPGDSMGSRHILDSLDGVSMYRDLGVDGWIRTELSGPVLVLEKERTLTHPEHGDWVLPRGIYRVSYQRAYSPKEVRRALD